MSKKAPVTHLIDIDELALETVTGGLTIEEGFPTSNNVMDMRGESIRTMGDFARWDRIYGNALCAVTIWCEPL